MLPTQPPSLPLAVGQRQWGKGQGVHALQLVVARFRPSSWSKTMVALLQSLHSNCSPWRLQPLFQEGLWSLTVHSAFCRRARAVQKVCQCWRAGQCRTPQVAWAADQVPHFSCICTNLKYRTSLTASPGVGCSSTPEAGHRAHPEEVHPRRRRSSRAAS